MTFTPSESVRNAFAPILTILSNHRTELASLPDVCAVRPGYHPDASGQLVPTLMLAVYPPADASAVGVGALSQTHGIPIAVVDATPQEQLRAEHERAAPADIERLLRGAARAFAPPRRGTYVPPGEPALDAVEEVMNVEISASPDVGWTSLRDFLARGVRTSLTVGIYQFTAPHVYKALRRTMLDAPQATLAICRQPNSEAIPDSGTKAGDLDGDVIIERLSRALGGRLDFVRASVHSGGAFASSYHIKVAVADSKRFWLSSGNWQSSNQSPFDPIDEPEALPAGYAGLYNRDYHVVVEHRGLASLFEAYLDGDRELPGATQFGRAIESSPVLVLPEEPEPVTFAPARSFLPLRLQGEQVRVTPVLTPDNYIQVVLPFLEQATRSIDLQNQYINVNAAGNFAEFEALLEVLRRKGEAGVQIRLLLRNFMDPEKVDMLLALGFKPEWFRFMKNCHAKLIVVDRAQALVGSHNWSNEGTVSNRDASLLFEHAGIAGYLADIFDEDWRRRGRVRPALAQPRVPRGNETFAVKRTVPWSEVYEEPPRPRTANTTTVNQGATTFGAKAVAQAPVGDVQLLGVHGVTGAPLHAPLPIAELVQRIQKAGPRVTGAEQLMVARRGESFDLPFVNDINDLSRTGWAVVYGPNTPTGVRQKLRPLLAHRQGALAKRLYREIEVVAGESVAQFLDRHKVAFGTQLPHQLPYHLLIVASPEDVSFEFQYLLDIEYSVGRLWFNDGDTPRLAAFEAYANAVVAYEKGAARRSRAVGFWGPRHAADTATELSTTQLLQPLFDGEPELGAVAALTGAASSLALGAQADSAALQQLLGDTGPAVVFTASHGVGFDPNHPDQLKHQGALVTSKWTGFGSIERKHYFAGEDLAGTNASGLVAFLFACFGAGTPMFDSYPDRDGVGTKTAEKPFIAALPQALLERGALGVIGHIDLAWGYSIRPQGASVAQPLPFFNALGRMLSGERLGNAISNLSSRAATLAAALTENLRPGAPAVDPYALADRWIEANDARAYILLGDPAARLSF